MVWRAPRNLEALLLWRFQEYMLTVRNWREGLVRGCGEFLLPRETV
jgi:hypothetical protein